MALLERIQGTEDPGLNSIVVASGLRELSRGAITRQQVIDELRLDAAAEAELDALISHYLTLDDQGKRDWITKVTDVFVLLDSQLYPVAKAKSELGI